MKNVLSPNQPKGLTMIEVVVAAGLLATAALATLNCWVSAERFNLINREEQVALQAAESVINEMRQQPVANLANYDKTTRKVDFGDGVNHGVLVPNELAIFIINEESPNESHFGWTQVSTSIEFPVDLNGNGSTTDIINTPTAGQIFPMDLGGSKAAINETLAPSLLRLFPVVIVVRWQSQAGVERRIQVNTFLTDRMGGM